MLKTIAKLRSKGYLKWILIGLVIRLVLMPITLHPDLWGHSFVAYFFAYKGVFNIYDYLLSLPHTHPLVVNFGVNDIFIYPPLTYFTLGIFRVLVKPFTDANFIPWLMVNISHVHDNPELPSQLFFFKLPYLFIDFAMAYLLTKLFDNPKRKLQVFAIWMLNPVTLYATFMMGQFDILPALFSVWALYFAKKEKYSYAALALGIGGSYKLYPLFFVIPLAFMFGKTLKQKAKLIGIGIAPFIAFSLPFLSSPGFRQMVLFSPKSEKMLYMQFPVSGAEGLYPFIMGLMIFFLIAYYKRTKLQLADYFLGILLLTFSITHYHPQWFLWITPFLAYKLVQTDFKVGLVISVFVLSWLYIVFTFDPSLSYGLFNPLWPNLGDATVGLTDVISKFTDANMVRSVVRSAFAGTAIYYIYSLCS